MQIVISPEASLLAGAFLTLVGLVMVVLGVKDYADPSTPHVGFKCQLMAPLGIALVVLAAGITVTAVYRGGL